MKDTTKGALALVLALGTTMCGTKAPKEEKVKHTEQMRSSERWIGISAAAQRFLVVKIAEAGNKPAGDFAGAASLGKPGTTLFYVLVPDAAAAVEIGHVSGGGTIALAKPQRITRMPGSALYTYFAADPANPGSLAFKAGGTETVVALSSQALQALPFFWSGEPAAIAFEEVPGWMEGSGP